ncbi:MAG: carbohydrate-binding protein [Myxococcales bacterium]|nr:carbohydrate-binding protein [Myxococcales bacterium]
MFYLSSFRYVIFLAALFISLPSEAQVTIQENSSGFCGVDGSVDSNNGNYTGGGFSNTDNAEGKGINWTINGDSGSYTFRWRYANGSSTNRSGVLSINGQNVSTEDFHNTGSWESWSTTSVRLQVSGGRKTVRLTSNQSQGLANIDYLEVNGPNVSAASCNGNDNDDDGGNNDSGCGGGSTDAAVTGSSGNYRVHNRSHSRYIDAIRAAISSVGSGDRVSVIASGSIGSNSIELPSNITFEVCGTLNASNRNGRGAIEAIGVRNVSIPQLNMTGSPYFGLRFADIDNLSLGQIKLSLSGGMGIRFERDLPSSRNVSMDRVEVSGTSNHGVETWNVDGLKIGTVIARNVARSGLLLNNSRNAEIGLVDGQDTSTGTGYATLRFANENGRVNGSYPTNIRVDRVIARRGGRGIFCVSNSGGVEIGSIDLRDNGNNAILIENCHNVRINGGSVRNSGDVRIAARNEFPNTSNVRISNLNVRDTNVIERPCGQNITWRNISRDGGSYNVCD